MNRNRNQSPLIQYALTAGADQAAIISTVDIVIDEKLADMCRVPQCPNYGLSRNCPPHVAGPAGFKKQLESFHQALFFTIGVSSEALFSSRRLRIFQQLHTIAADIERSAVDLGFSRAQAYAGGSCKELFCSQHPDCLPLCGTGECRHPRLARPSMSGFGIDTAALFNVAGWTLNRAVHQAGSQADITSPDNSADICGLVLVG